MEEILLNVNLALSGISNPIQTSMLRFPIDIRMFVGKTKRRSHGATNFPEHKVCKGRHRSSVEK